MMILFIHTMSRIRTLNHLAAILLLPWLCASEETYKSAKAKFYQMPDGLGTPSGACGYGEYGRTVYSGNVAAVSSRSLYRSGAGCGACFQVKCKASECSDKGVNVLVTDDTGADEAEFILSSHAFAAMATPGEGKAIKDYGVVDVDYKRVPCKFAGGESLRLKVLEQSSYPYYLSFVFQYQGGISSITAVEIFDQETVGWQACTRSYGAVWEISNPPKDPQALTLRVFLPGGGAARWVLLPKAVPTPWKPGASYDTSVQIE